jgi:hypothetical protein
MRPDRRLYRWWMWLIRAWKVASSVSNQLFDGYMPGWLDELRVTGHQYRTQALGCCQGNGIGVRDGVVHLVPHGGPDNITSRDDGNGQMRRALS